MSSLESLRSPERGIPSLRTEHNPSESTVPAGDRRNFSLLKQISNKQRIRSQWRFAQEREINPGRSNKCWRFAQERQTIVGASRKLPEKSLIIEGGTGIRGAEYACASTVLGVFMVSLSKQY